MLPFLRGSHFQILIIFFFNRIHFPLSVYFIFSVKRL
jgi:hypothetical protein